MNSGAGYSRAPSRFSERRDTGGTARKEPDVYALEMPHGGAKTGYKKNLRNHGVAIGNTCEEVRSVISKAKRMISAGPNHAARTPHQYNSKGS